MNNMTPFIFLVRKLKRKSLSLCHKKSIYFRLKNIEPEKKPFFSDRFRFLLGVILFPTVFLRRLKRTNAEILIFDPSINYKLHEVRKDYVSHYRKSNKDENNEIEVINGTKVYYSGSISLKQGIKIFKIWFVFFQTAILSLFVKNTKSVSWAYSILIYLINMCLLEKQVREVYFFHLYTTKTYISALLFESYFKISINAILGNSPIFGTSKYTCLKKSTLIICSKYQIEEIQNYINFGWIKMKELKVWGLEEINKYKNLKPSRPVYDIGIYSFGSWTRVNGITRSREIERIRNLDFVSNNKYIAFNKVLDKIIEIKNTNNLSVKLYLHPFERLLISKHNIYPPYFNKLDENNISYDLKGEDSVSKIYEAKIGISIASTIIFDRWHLGLSGFIFFDSQQSKKTFYYDPKYLESYRPYIFNTIEELNEKLLSEFQLKLK